uniref:Uncharacterized protein n=1 Tax=Arundo donax TaxID=35708 RepID=A0A0A9FQB9_ARUDO
MPISCFWFIAHKVIHWFTVSVLRFPNLFLYS